MWEMTEEHCCLRQNKNLQFRFDNLFDCLLCTEWYDTKQSNIAYHINKQQTFIVLNHRIRYVLFLLNYEFFMRTSLTILLLTISFLSFFWNSFSFVAFVPIQHIILKWKQHILWCQTNRIVEQKLWESNWFETWFTHSRKKRTSVTNHPMAV